MSILGSSWKDESVLLEEKYENITGQQYTGNNLRKDVEKEIESNYTSKESRKQLLNLLQEIYEND